MFTVELTSFGQSLISSQIVIDGIILLYDYIENIYSLTDISSYTITLDEEACGNINKTVGNVRIHDNSTSEYQAKTVLFYIKVNNEKKIVAGYSQTSAIVQKYGGPVTLFLSFDFSSFTNGFLFSSIQAGYGNAYQNNDGIVHIENPDITTDDAFSVYSKQQTDTNFLTLGTNQTITGAKTINNMLTVSGMVGPYVYCETGGSTVKKEVVIPNFQVVEGSRLLIKFKYSHTNNTPPTLCIHNTSGDNANSYAIMLFGTNRAGSTNYYNWMNNEIIELVFDGTYWYRSGFQYATVYSESSNYTEVLYDGLGEGVNVSGYYYHEGESDETITFKTDADIVPSTDESLDLGKPDLQWNGVYANTFHGNATSSTNAQGLSKIVSNTDYTLSLNANNCWQPNTAIETTSQVGPYVYCQTAAGTVKKEVTIPNFQFRAGSRLLVKFQYANSASNPTLCIHNVAEDTGTTYAIMRYGSNAIGSGYLSWSENQIIELVFDGTYWYWQGSQYSVYSAHCLYNTYNIDGVGFNGTGNRTHFGNCSTAANTQIKDVVITGFNNTSLLTGSRVSVKFANSNTAQNPQLRVSSSSTNGTAKPIIYRGTSPISNSSNYYRWQAGSIIEFVYDGTNWVWVGFQEYAKYSDFSNNTYYLCGSDGDGLYGDWYILEDESEEPVFVSDNSILPMSSGDYDLGKPDIVWNNVYALTFNGDLSGNATTATSATTSTTAQGLSKTVSNTNYTLALNANNCWQPNTAIETTSQVGPYAYCQTAAATAKKEVTIPNFQFRAGSRLLVKFQYANSASNPTLCIHNEAGDTGITYYIRNYGSSSVEASNYLSWLANQIVELVFDGTYWYRQGFQYYAYSANTASSATSATSASYTGRIGTSSTDYFTYNNSSDALTSFKNIIPTSSETYNLGSSNRLWNEIHASTIYSDEIVGNGFGDIAPIQTNSYHLGDSNYRWASAYINNTYTNNINIVFISVEIRVPYDASGTNIKTYNNTKYLEIPVGTILDSSVYVVTMYYANLHFITGTDNVAYNYHWKWDSFTGSYKTLARIQCGLNSSGEYTYRQFIVPAIKVV